MKTSIMTLDEVQLFCRLLLMLARQKLSLVVDFSNYSFLFSSFFSAACQAGWHFNSVMLLNPKYASDSTRGKKTLHWPV